jgi:hypothetical protein
MGWASCLSFLAGRLEALSHEFIKVGHEPEDGRTRYGTGGS